MQYPHTAEIKGKINIVPTVYVALYGEVVKRNCLRTGSR
jgi:hypothetical protein